MLHMLLKCKPWTAPSKAYSFKQSWPLHVQYSVHWIHVFVKRKEIFHHEYIAYCYCCLSHPCPKRKILWSSVISTIYNWTSVACLNILLLSGSLPYIQISASHLSLVAKATSSESDVWVSNGKKRDKILIGLSLQELLFSSKPMRDTLHMYSLLKKWTVCTRWDVWNPGRHNFYSVVCSLVLYIWFSFFIVPF